MLFDLRPKESLRDLFDRHDEFSELSRLIAAGSWVVVMGKRMTGKTSLIKTYAKKNGGVYISLMGAAGIEDLARKLLSVSGMRLEEVGVDLRFVHAKWSKLAEDAFSKVEGKVIVLDEVQEISSPYLLKVLKAAWDTHRELKIVFSGSYIGIMKGLLDPNSASPLYGRTPARVVLSPFTTQSSLKFLHDGFHEHRAVKVTEVELEECVDRLNGYVGWLTHYGNYRCVRKLSHQEALKETMREGSKILLSEVNNFLKNRRRDLYVNLLRMLSKGANWSEMKRELDVNSKVLRDVLRTLTGALLVEQRNGYYWIDDPILRETTRNLR